MTAGDLTPNMIGKTRIRTRFEEAEIEGFITAIEIETESTHLSAHGGGRLRSTCRVTLDVTVGRIQMTSVPLDHPIQILA